MFVSIAQSRLAQRKKTSEASETFKGKIELKKYSIEEYNSMPAAQRQ